MIRTIIVDDHPLVRAGLRELLDREPDIEVVADASSATKALEAVRRKRPDVVVIDVGLPDQSGVRTIEQIRREHPSTRCVALTMHDEPSLVRAALAAGADAYVLKRSVDREILTAIRRARLGQRHVDPELAMQVAAPSGRTEPVELSARELQVLRRVALGHTSADIGTELGLSAKSIESYRSRLRQKLCLDSRADIVRYALELGIVGPTTADDEKTG